MRLPPPTTFADGQRKLYGLAAGVAGIVFGIAVLVGASIVVFGDWGQSLLPTQLYILGGCLAVGSIGTIAVTIGLLVGGPVGRFKVRADRNGAEWEAAAPGEPMTTTTTTTTPSASTPKPSAPLSPPAR